MVTPSENNKSQTDEQRMPPAETGNASNPSPQADIGGNNQFLDEKAEKYLREVASIEDVPDAQDQQDMENQIKEEGSANQ